VVRRIVLRDEPAPRTVRWVAASATAAAIVSGGAALWSGSSWFAVGVFAATTWVAVAATVLAWVPTAIAVSIVGVALACACLATALSVTEGFRSEILGSAARIHGHVLLSKYGLDFFEYDGLARRLREDPRIVAASPFAYSMGALVGERDPVIVLGKGLDPEFAGEVAGLSSLFEGGDVGALRPGDTGHLPGLVVGSGVMRRLGLELGDEARIVVPAELESGNYDVNRPPRWATFQVLDVVHTGTSELDASLVLMHLTAAQAVFFREGRVSGIELQLTDPELADEIAQELQTELGFPYRLSTWKETNAPLLAGLQQARATLSVVLGLMILVSGSSLLATMLLLVRRKRGDIAVLRTLGADHRNVFWCFEALGVTLGAVGAGLGSFVAALSCAVLATQRFPLGADVFPVDHLPVALRLADAVGPALAAVGVCALATGPVAVQAARGAILDALRS